MSDILRRNIPPSEGRDKYGTWDLSNDQVSPDEDLDDAYEPRSPHDWSEETDRSVRLLMKRQRRLSLTAAGSLFGAVLVAVVASHLFPEIMSVPVWRNFSPALLTIGVIAYPVTWVIALVYVLLANRMDGLR
ncbi:MAG: DUF485 domain-containing protein [Actinobacteria bacterium]|nr:DUF485 domain-containing protein [Actinomycetota bacterium]